MRSRREFKRLRPALGTFVSLTLSVEESALELAASAVTNAFHLIAREEKRYSRFHADSEISALNSHSLGEWIHPSGGLIELIKFCLDVREQSGGAFEPFTTDVPAEGIEVLDSGVRRLLDVQLDLTGAAKGAIVDLAVDSLTNDLAGTEWSGVVNAGGDLRFVNEPAPVCHVKIDDGETSLSRSLLIPPDFISLHPNPAVASSSLFPATTDSRSTTRYRKSLRSGLTERSVVTVIAPSARTADALTKVGLFSAPEIIQRCADNFQSLTLVFTSAGEVAESYLPR